MPEKPKFVVATASAPSNGWLSVDGNEAAAAVAHKLSEVIAIYPITPASPMGEHSDAWSAAGRRNLWGVTPRVVEMQSEAGAAGVLHGALLRGSLATTFTSSQGLLLMIPNMYKIAGELIPAVIHVAARTLATHALSIFGDHSDVMAARATGFAMLCSSSVQEAQDLALVAHAATLEGRVPFIHFFDGFRTSHEIAKIQSLGDDDLAALVDEGRVAEHRARGLTPDVPVLRGSAQNPDVFFQSREAANPFYAAIPGIVQGRMDALAQRTGRSYNLVDYVGADDADRVIVAMGSGVTTVEETVEKLCALGEKVGLVKIRLFRPFPSEAFLAALPATVRSIAVLDRTKEPGSVGEPLYQDVVTTLAERARGGSMPRIIGGRYGLSSKEFTPAMAKSVYDELSAAEPRSHFTVGIDDDVSHTSLAYDPDFSTEDGDLRALFYGLGSDGTVGACKNTVKIVNAGEAHAQGYFVYDSKKAGSVTVSHLRSGRRPIRSSYLIEKANFVACHQFSLLRRVDVLGAAEAGATFLLNTEHGPDEVWDHLTAETQAQIIEKQLKFYVVDAYDVARSAGLGRRINTAMQPCFFELAGVLPAAEARTAIKDFVAKTYAKSGDAVVQQNFAAVDAALAALRPVSVPVAVTSNKNGHRADVSSAPVFVQQVTSRLMAGEGDALPVSALPADGVFPTGTAAWDRPCLATEVPVWDPSICIDCGRCTLVCPHDALQMKVFDPELLDDAPEDFPSKPFRSKELPGMQMTIQVDPGLCTSCGICVDMCPVLSKREPGAKSINMGSMEEHGVREQERSGFFASIPALETNPLSPASVKGSQTRPSLFGCSGACSGCGETPYLKLLTQLLGDRLLVANATGCSSIYGGNLPTTPWGVNEAGRGPAWANSLFEDNAEFGLGMRLALDQNVEYARHLLGGARSSVGNELVDALLDAEQGNEFEVNRQRDRVATLKFHLRELTKNTSAGEEGPLQQLLDLADVLVTKSVWTVGGDGWAYDIGFGGVDHVLASEENVNLLVLDTQVYSNTGGQASKATPRGAVASFATAGKQTRKKDLGMIAAAYGNVYVAQVAMGADPAQTVKAFAEAEAWPGPSIIIAYSTCIAHGIDMATSMSHQGDAVTSGFWPLWRYLPGCDADETPFRLDSKTPTLPLRDFIAKEARFTRLQRSDPEAAERLLKLAQADVDERWRYYEQMAGIKRSMSS